MTIRRAISPLILAAFLSCGVLHAQSTPVPARTETASPTPAVSQEEELQQLRRERDVAQIRADLIAAQTDWFAILVSVLMSGFSLLVAGVVIFFTFRFGKAAVAEAKQGMAEERELIQKLLEEANAAVAAIRGHEQTAREITAGLKPGEAPANEADELTLREIARRAEAKPARERTLDEYLALVSVAGIGEDWEVLERRASEMAILFEAADDETIAFALLNLGIARGQLERPIEAIAAFENLLLRFGESVRPELQDWVALALYNKGVALGVMERPVEVIAAYDELLRRFGESDAPALQEQVATALVNKGITLGALDRADEEIAAYDEVLRRFGESDNPALQEQAAKALFNKGVKLGALDRADEEIAAYDEVLRRFGESDAPALQEQVAKALLNKGVRLGALDRRDEEIAAYDEVVRRFGESEQPALQELVATALYNLACVHAIRSAVPECIAALSRWRERRGGLDCEAIASDTDFDGVRLHPDFVDFLSDSGCPPSPPHHVSHSVVNKP